MRGLMMLGVIGLLAGCAMQPSYVMQGLNGEASAATAADITAFVCTELKPDSVIVLDRATGDTAVAPQLAQDLHQAGYRLAASGPHHLRYEISTMSEGTVLRVMLDHATAARLYQESSGVLESAGPLTVVEVGE